MWNQSKIGTMTYGDNFDEMVYNFYENYLRERGIQRNLDELFEPNESSVLDPILMKNLVPVANRIYQAIINEENITISSDPDVDGITSTLCMYKFLLGYLPKEKITIIYHERSKGHGIQNQVDFLDKEWTDLLIVVDSSSSEESFDVIEDILLSGVEVVVIDHHECDGNHPTLLVNPNQKGCNYPNKDLSGVGVVFKVIEYISNEFLDDNYYLQFLDLVAVGLIGDVMSLASMENRWYISEGLRNIKDDGLKRILKSKSINERNVATDTVSFTLAPLINGVLRMDSIETVLYFFFHDFGDKNRYHIKVFRELEDINEKRREIQDELTERYRDCIVYNKEILIAIGDFKSTAFNGIVAQNLSEEFGKTAFVVRNKKGVCRGSFRGYGYDVRKHFSGCEAITTYGHPMAGGIKFNIEDLEVVKDYCNQTFVEGEIKVFDGEFDLYLDVEDMTIENAELMNKINFLTGRDFPKIVFRVDEVQIESRNVIGKGNTVKFISSNDSNMIDFLKFRTDETYFEHIDYLSEADFIGEFNLNSWYDFKNKKTIKTPQLFITDIIEKESWEDDFDDLFENFFD